MKKLLVVDGNSIVNRAFYGVRPLSNKEGLPTNALFGMVSILEKNLEAVKPDFCAIAFDVKAPTFRHGMYDAYKAGRKPTPEDLLVQMPLAKELAAALGFVCLEKPGYEADDILGTLAATAENEGAEAYILTGDRDALQLITKSTNVLLATNTETVLFDEARFFEKYGVRPDQFVDVKALMGDSSDNIPGVSGIGEKTALRLIGEYGSLQALYEQMTEKSFTPALYTKLSGGKDSAFLSQNLATICKQVPLSLCLSDLVYHGHEKEKLLPLFQKYEFRSFIKRFELDAPDPVELKAAQEIALAPFDESFALDGVFCFDFIDGKGYAFDGKVLALLQSREEIEALLFKKDAFVICHDAKTVYKSLQKAGISWRGCAFDTMLAAYVLNPSEKSYDLEPLAETYIQTRVCEAPRHLGAIYALYQTLSQRVRELSQEKLLFEIEMPLCAVLADMELSGFAVNREGQAARSP